MSRELSQSSPSSIRDSIYKMWRKLTQSYDTQKQTGQFHIDGKPIYRKTINTGQLLNTTTKNVAHGITGMDTVLSISGAATDDSGAFALALPMPSANVTMLLGPVNIDIATAADLTAYDTSFVTIEFTMV